MTTHFTDPAPPAGPQFADPVSPVEAKRKKWIVNGRYALPDPDNGKPRTWTRVTNMDVLSDKYAINEWEKRKIAKGLAMRPDLVAMASALDPDSDRDAMNKLAREAKEAAGGSAGANLGTALHKLTERVDAGEDVDAGMFAGEMAAYRSALATEGLSVDPAYLERIVSVPELGCAGRLDKLLRVPQGETVTHQVGDLKSQKSMDFGGLGIAIQLSIYSRAYAVWNEETEAWEDPPAMDQEMATVIWLPVGRSLCEMYDVDLSLGWEFARMAFDVRGRVRKAPVVRKRAASMPVVTPLALAMPPGAFSVSETVSESGINGTNFPANAASQAEMVAPSTEGATVGGPSGTWRGPDHQVPEGTTWEDRFRQATTAEELTSAGVQAAQAYGGQLPDSLKVLGRELRAKLTEHASAA